jgi:hypothetical protein
MIIDFVDSFIYLSDYYKVIDTVITSNMKKAIK